MLYSSTDLNTTTCEIKSYEYTSYLAVIYKFKKKDMPELNYKR